MARGGPAAELPPDAPASRGLRAEVRRTTLELAHRFGPARQIERWTCNTLSNIPRDYCNGAAYSCDFNGQLEKGPLHVKIPTCHDRASGWQLAGFHRDFPEAPPPSASAPGETRL